MTPDRDALLTPQALDAWLAAFAINETVGARLSIRACPLARYLSQRTGYIWRIWGSEAEPAEGPEADQITVLPAWAQQFTAAVDSHAHDTLSAREARGYLREALQTVARHRGEC